MMNIRALIKSLMLRKFTTSLLMLQLALTLGLIVNSGILAFDTRDKLLQDTGLDLDNTLVVEMLPTSGAYKDSDYYRSITLEDFSKIEAMPGVNGVAPSVQLPIQDGGWNGNVTSVDNPEAAQTDRHLNYVTFFYTRYNLPDVFGLELLEGRHLTENDVHDPERKVEPNIVITEALAKALYGEKSAIGQMTSAGAVVGVVSNMLINPRYGMDKQYAVFFNEAIYFDGITQHYIINVEPGMVESVRKQVSDVILAVQPERDIYDLYTMREHISNFYETDQGLVSLFATLVLLMVMITAISSYAYAQFHMTQQTKLIGIRRALGASKKDIMLYVLTENWLVYLVGCLLGIASALGFNILLSQYIELSKPSIWLSLVGIGVMFISSTVATWLPARKTSNIPPVIATRTV